MTLLKEKRITLVDINDTDYILNAVEESKKIGGITSVRDAYLEGLTLLDKLSKNGI